MKIKFRKDITVDVARYPSETEDKAFHRNDIIEVNEIIPVSDEFVYITLPDYTCLIDLRIDLFEEVV
jgi:hypothetical protein